MRVGLHLVLVEGKPMLPASAVPDLVDAAGISAPTWRGPARRCSSCPRCARQLAAEIEAQFDAFAATGLTLDHVNAHKHFHLHPTIAALDGRRSAKRHGVKGARVPLEPQDVLARIEPHKACRRGGADRALCARACARRFRRAGIAAPDQVFGLAWSGAMTAPRLKGLIENLPDGLTEIYLHPATGAYPGSAPGYHYAEELRGPDRPAACRRLIARARYSPWRLLRLSGTIDDGNGAFGSNWLGRREIATAR